MTEEEELLHAVLQRIRALELKVDSLLKNEKGKQVGFCTFSEGGKK